MRSPGEETWDRRKKTTENRQDRGWRVGKESRGRSQARYCSGLVFFLFLGRLMSLQRNKKGRFTEEWRWEMLDCMQLYFKKATEYPRGNVKVGVG